MPVRRLLLIDDDPEFQELLEERLAPSGFEVVLPLDPSNPLGHVKDLRPAIIIISVELPDKVGYALCNKAKKGLARDIPVILTTRSVPASGFRSHRKLKVHADEYIDKRAMSEQEVVAKVDQLVGLGRPGGDHGFRFEDVDVEELDMADLVEDGHGRSATLEVDDDDDEISAVPRQIAHEGLADEFDPRELGADADDDGSFDFGEQAEIDHERAMAGRGSNGGRAQTATAVGTDPGAFLGASEQLAASWTGPDVDIDSDMNEFEADRTAVASPFPLTFDSPSARIEIAGPPAAAAPLVIEPEPSAPVADLDLGLDQVATLAEVERAEPPGVRIGARTAELEREIDRLRGELEQSRRVPTTGSPFSREREFLNLREVINKKEKQILDLNDQIDAKERLVMAERDRLREMDRVRSDLDARNLELEQNLLGASEELDGLRGERGSVLEQLRRQTDAMGALRTDAEQLSCLLERERASWREERDGLTRRHEVTLDQQKQQLEGGRASLEASLRERHTADLRGLKQAYEENSAEKDKGFGAAMALAEVRRQEELSAAQRGAEERLHLEVNELRRRHQDEIESLRREQAADLETLVRQNQEARQALEDRQSAHIATLEEEQSQALAAADRRRASELADADRRRVAELGEAERRRVAELVDADKRRGADLAEADERRRRDLAAADQERARAEEELEERLAAELAALVRQHAAEREEMSDRLAGRTRELGELGDQLAAAREVLRAREETIASLHVVLGERDERLAGQRQDLDELERQNAGYQEQVLRAFQKIKADEETVARAKKAMAIALTLLDEGEPAAARDE